jgi:transposase
VGRRAFCVQDLVELLRRWQAGDSPRRIAKGLGLSRNTVRGYIREAEAAGVSREQGWSPEQWAAFVRERFPQTESPAARAVWWAELEQHRDEIVRRLADNRVTTVWRRMHDNENKIKASLSTFRRYVRARIPQAVDPARVVIHGVRCEPGELAEVDFGRLGRVAEPATGKLRTLWAFIMVLVYSRHLFVAPVFSMDQETWLRCHLMAFAFFGGTVQRLILDNLKDGVLKPDIYDPVLNRAYGEMGRYYDILLDPARSGSPKDKPHVERSVPFVREHLFRGREERFPDLSAGAAWAERWCREEAGSRIHRTTGRRPLELFMEAEQPALRPLPAAAWELCTWERAPVALDSCCLVAGARYSVPWRLLERTLDARVTAKRVEFFQGTELVKTHPRAARGTRRVDDADLPQERIAFFRRTAPWCLEQAATMGPDVCAAVTELLETRTNARLRQAQRILELEATYGSARLNAACARASAFGDPRYLTIKNILAAGLDQQPGQVPFLPPDRPTQAGAFLRGPEAFAAAGPAYAATQAGSPRPAFARVPDTPPLTPDGIPVGSSRP